MYQLKLPESSKLFSLKPEGIGTPYVESLASYVMRLAEDHCLHVCDLIYRFVYPLSRSAWKDTRSQRRIMGVDKISRHGITLAHLHIKKWLGMSKETEATVAALSELTKRDELHLLTLLPLKGYVKQDSVLRFGRAWCPSCYDEQKNANKQIHDLLIWSFQDISVCLSHRQRLRSSCPWCVAKQPVLNYQSQPGHCAGCGMWLGNDGLWNSQGFNSSFEPAFQDVYNSEAVGYLLTKWDSLQPPTCRRSLKRMRPFKRLLTMSDDVKDMTENLLG